MPRDSPRPAVWEWLTGWSGRGRGFRFTGSAIAWSGTRNVVWALGSNPWILRMVDVHSAVAVILHNWGSDRNQSTPPSDNFRNPDLDGC